MQIINSNELSVRDVAGLEHYLQQRDNGSPTQSRRNELLLDSIALNRKSSHFLTFPQHFFFLNTDSNNHQPRSKKNII
jgi:hypothetical protein